MVEPKDGKAALLGSKTVNFSAPLHLILIFFFFKGILIMMFVLLYVVEF